MSSQIKSDHRLFIPDRCHRTQAAVVLNLWNHSRGNRPVFPVQPAQLTKSPESLPEPLKIREAAVLKNLGKQNRTWSGKMPHRHPGPLDPEIQNSGQLPCVRQLSLPS